MRGILFRGKRIDSGEWLYGDLFHGVDGLYIQYWDNGEYRSYEIASNTVGQYTGMTDKNGINIFEGDIVEYDNDKRTIGVVKHTQGTFDSGIYKYNGWVVVEKDGNVDHTPLLEVEKDSIFENMEYGEIVLGNIFDNLELMER